MSHEAYFGQIRGVFEPRVFWEIDDTEPANLGTFTDEMPKEFADYELKSLAVVVRDFVIEERLWKKAPKEFLVDDCSVPRFWIPKSPFHERATRTKGANKNKLSIESELLADYRLHVWWRLNYWRYTKIYATCYTVVDSFTEPLELTTHVVSREPWALKSFSESPVNMPFMNNRDTKKRATLLLSVTERRLRDALQTIGFTFWELQDVKFKQVISYAIEEW